MSDRADFEIRIGPDGRVYFDGLTADLLEVAAAVCPGDASLARRLEKARRTRGPRTDTVDLARGQESGAGILPARQAGSLSHLPDVSDSEPKAEQELKHGDAAASQ